MTEEEKPAKGTDYAAGQKKGKEVVPEKNIIPVVKGEVVEQKRGIGRKIKDVFVAADFKTVGHYVIYEVIIPAAKNMLFEGASRGAERMIYGENRFRPRGGIFGNPQGFFGSSPMPGSRSRVTYNMTSEGYRDPMTNPPGATVYPRQGGNDFLLVSKQDADAVLDEMYNLLSKFESVSVAEFHELMNLPSVHTDQKWGWTDLRGIQTRQVREGWVIDLPKPEPLM